MYSLLANGDVSTMKLLSSSGVLPGAGGGGATQTYSPSKQKCDSGCALDGTGCGALGNDIDLDRCPGGPVSGLLTSPPTLSPPTLLPTPEPTLRPTPGPSLRPTPGPTPGPPTPLLTPESTLAPTLLLIPGPVPPPSGVPEPPFTICFSGRNMVLTKERGYIRIEDVEIGDMVHAGHNKYSRIYSFGHRNQHNYAQYLQLHFGDQPLEISHDHMVFVDRLGAIPASKVGVGDKLLLGAGGVIKVTKISTVNRQGAFAPFTESGTIVVSDILASSYVSLQEESANFEVAGVNIVSMQWLAHAFQAPHRMVCRWNSEFCKTETYTEEGISKRVYGPFLASKWLLGQHVVIVAVLSVPAVMTGVVLYLVEAIFSNLALSCLAAILVLSFCHKHNTKKTKSA
jgi:hypothetical protein